MRIARGLFERVVASGRDCVVVVGTAKNVGKTTTVGVLLREAAMARVSYGITSIGRDGEAVDASDAREKPRVHVAAGTVYATARETLVRTPASEIIELGEPTALGRIAFARARFAMDIEIAGPPTVRGLRATIERLRALGAQMTIVDGAVDRLAVIGGGGDAVIVATGASAATTPRAVVAGVAALVERLRTPRFDPTRESLHIDGALHASAVAALAAAGERRQIVVRDATRILARAPRGIDIRVERPIEVVACTVASVGRMGSMDPARLVEDVARATGLPTFDVVAELAA